MGEIWAMHIEINAAGEKMLCEQTDTKTESFLYALQNKLQNGVALKKKNGKNVRIAFFVGS